MHALAHCQIRSRMWSQTARCDGGAQVLAKSCKMIPVMLMGTLIGGKFYSTLEYGCALLIAAGISLFAKQSSSKVTAKLVAPNAPLGYALCAANLLFDGYTNAAQVRRSLPFTVAAWPSISCRVPLHEMQ